MRKTLALIDGRVELTLLGVSRYGFRSTELAEIIRKHPSSMTRRLNEGLSREREDPRFRDRMCQLDRQISATAQE